jgi:hypothetical protein
MARPRKHPRVRSPHRPSPVWVPRWYRERVIARYPLLCEDAFWTALLEYFLFSTAFDPEIDRLIFCRDVIADVAGLGANDGRFPSGWVIEEVERRGLPLNASSWSPALGFCRTVRPEFDPEIVALRDQIILSGPVQDRVSFVTGESWSDARLQAERIEYRQRLLSAARAVNTAHPGYELLQYLNQQPQDLFAQTVRRNREALRKAIARLPEGKHLAREAAMRALRQLDAFPEVYYHGVPNSVRFFASGSSLHTILSDLRRIALGGGVEMDAASCQAAIAAAIWRIKELQTFLEARGSLWSEFQGYLGVGAEARTVLKGCLYSTLYGMPLPQLKAQLTRGKDGVLGLGRERSWRLFDHPLMRAILGARERVQEQIVQEGCGWDAFGRMLPLDRRKPRAIMCQIAQSFELRLMMSILPILRREPDVAVLSFLHDGITVGFRPEGVNERVVAALAAAFDTEASSLGICTRLEHRQLPVPA